MGKEKEDKCCHEKIDLNIRVVPDGGWGWIISMAAFTVQFIILGLQNNLGLLHREYLNHFKRKNAETGMFLSYTKRSFHTLYKIIIL